MGGYLVLIVLIVAVVGVVILNDQSNAKIKREKAERLRAANEAYKQALVQLKTDPSNPNVKQRALELGRAYAAITREQSGAGSGVTIFDEMALSNDISAATAGATASKSSASVEDRLRSLDTLRTKGLVNDAEYAERRRQILAEI